MTDEYTWPGPERQPLVDQAAASAAADAIRGAFLALGESWGTLVEATAGYKGRLIEAGFSEHAAEHMAVQFHGYLVNTFGV